MQNLDSVAATFESLYFERTVAVLRGTASVEWLPADARVLFTELAAAHPGLSIHDRADLQPLLDAARRRATRKARSVVK